MKLVKAFLYVVIICLLLELALRLCGIHPFPHFNNAETEKKVEKGFSNYMCNDDSIGIMPCPSGERIIYQADRIPFKISHLPDGSRYCGSGNPAAPVILITGDSNTHGDGVNDSNHVGFLLQASLPYYRVINRSIPGSGNVSQLQVLKNSLRKYTPEIVIATYGSYHNDRNIFSRGIRKAFRMPGSKAASYKFPMAYMEGDKMITTYGIYQYTPVPFSDFSSVFEGINLLMEKYERSRLEAGLVTLKTWEAYVSICRSKNIQLCVILTTRDALTDRLSVFFKRNEVRIIPVSFTDAMTFKPLDSHPNNEGHRHFASEIHRSLNNFGWIKP